MKQHLTPQPGRAATFLSLFVILERAEAQLASAERRCRRAAARWAFAPEQCERWKALADGQHELRQHLRAALEKPGDLERFFQTVPERALQLGETADLDGKPTEELREHVQGLDQSWVETLGELACQSPDGSRVQELLQRLVEAFRQTQRKVSLREVWATDV